MEGEQATASANTGVSPLRRAKSRAAPVEMTACLRLLRQVLGFAGWWTSGFGGWWISHIGSCYFQVLAGGDFQALPMTNSCSILPSGFR